MKKYLKGFIPAYLIQNNFMLGLLNDLREKRIDALIDAYQGGTNRDLVAHQIRHLRNPKCIVQGEIDRFVIRYHNGYYWVKKDPRIVIDPDFSYQSKRVYLWKYRILSAFVECTDESYESDIHYTIKIPKGMTAKEIIADLREYNESRCSHSPYDCSGAEIGYAYALPQNKKGELRIVDCIRYDY